ncbi:hypothetical protein KQI65_09230 [bacterium]|nr:hypothetical protein [bacterium]
MREAGIFLDSSRVISTQFDLGDLPLQDMTDEEREQRFRSMLIERIVELLSGNTEHLMHILYRVDVSEAAVSRVFNDTPLPDIAPALAELIIARQMEKARTRAAYRAQRESGQSRISE